MPYAYKPFDLMVMEMAELMDENDKLKLENAKLRELVCDMWDCEYACKPTDCDMCDTQCLWQEFGARMVELGIKET